MVSQTLLIRKSSEPRSQKFLSILSLFQTRVLNVLQFPGPVAAECVESELFADAQSPCFTASAHHPECLVGADNTQASGHLLLNYLSENGVPTHCP